MAITGAILGDIAGSWLEENWDANIDYKNYPLFTEQCQFTDDTVMTLAIKKAIDTGDNFISTMREIGQNYPYCGWGKMFYYWIFCKDPKPYNSFGNGSAMRVSYIGEYYENPLEVRKKARESALVSHNHPEGVKGAVVTAMCIWMAKHGKTKDEILDYVIKEYPPEKYEFNATQDLDYLRKNYTWDSTCQTSVSVAVRCFYESDSYISFIQNVFSIFCDTDTIGAIGGGIAEEYYKTTGLENDKLLKKYLSKELYAIYKGE